MSLRIELTDWSKGDWLHGYWRLYRWRRGISSKLLRDVLTLF